MSTPCTVIISAIELLDALRQNAAADGEVLIFSDSEPLKALEAIATCKPTIVALERLFAATSRGAALINRIKADPALTDVEIRVVSLDGSYRVSPRRTPVPPPRLADAILPAPIPAAAEPVIEAVEEIPAVEAVEEAPAVEVQPAQNLDYRGTRRAPRFRVAPGTEAQIDGALATVVDLSTCGAQILSPIPLKPQQRLRMILADDLGMVKLSATVAWAFFEIPKGQTSRYRAGVEFKDGESKAIEAFGKRHQPPKT